jgi:hypothetical protein
MLTTARKLRIVLSTFLAWLPAATALAGPFESGSDADSPALLAVLIAFCTLVVGLLAYTAHRMARLQ